MAVGVSLSGKAAKRSTSCVYRSASAMGLTTMIGKYQLGKMIGEGAFAKVKVAVNMETGQHVAVKILNKQMIMEKKLMHQVKSEIKTLKLLHHPNIVRIYEVMATKTKIYLIMEYIVGGQLSDKIAYMKRLTEREARKYFQQLMDAVDYFHQRGVYHRDLKPENLLLDWKGDLKVCDFGLSVLKKPNAPLSTSCGSPSHIAPEVITDKSYDGAAADVWACGVILYELLAGYLPFEDGNMLNLYRKIGRAEYICPRWFSGDVRRLLFKILDPNPSRRMTVAEIMKDEWFQIDYKPSFAMTENRIISSNDVNAAFGDKTDKEHSHFINAFHLISMSVDISGLFKEQNNEHSNRRYVSRHTISKTMGKIEAAAKNASLSVEHMDRSKMKIQRAEKTIKSGSYFTLSAEVTEISPTYSMVEVSIPDGDVMEFNEFCRNLSSILEDRPSHSSSNTISHVLQHSIR